jgi:septal ring factor EnvC (AmiA/AmiB activator)
MSTPSNTDNIIDSRDIISRLEDLNSELDDLKTEIEEAEEAIAELDKDATEEERQQAAKDLEDAEQALEDWQDENGEEHKALTALNQEGEDNIGDWTHGETLIHADYFTTYAEELAEEIGDIPRNLKWPFTHIDWKAAADELKYDYTELDFDGATYYARA